MVSSPSSWTGIMNRNLQRLYRAIDLKKKIIKTSKEEKSLKLVIVLAKKSVHEATGFDNYYKIPVLDHVCGTKFWHIHVRVQIYIYKKRYQVS